MAKAAAAAGKQATAATRNLAAEKRATVTMRNLAAKLSEDHELSKKQTEAVLGDLVALITKYLKKGDRIRLGGLGILEDDPDGHRLFITSHALNFNPEDLRALARDGRASQCGTASRSIWPRGGRGDRGRFGEIGTELHRLLAIEGGNQLWSLIGIEPLLKI